MTDTDTRPEIRDTPRIGEAGTKMPTRLIRPAADNLRGDVGDVSSLAESIKAHGLFQRILIAPLDPGDAKDDGCEFVCVDGHRRLAAAVEAGFTRVPVDIRFMGEAQRVEAMLVTALQREGLSPTEEAEGYRRLVELGHSQRDIAKMFDGRVSQGHVSKRLALTRLPEAARRAVDAGGITVEQAVALTRVPTGQVEKLFAGKNPPKNWEVDEAVRWADLAKKRADAEAAATKAGLAIVDRGGVSRNAHTGRPVWLSQLIDFGRVDGEESHTAEPCHAVAWDGTKMKPVCTDPASHPDRPPASQDDDGFAEDDDDGGRTVPIPRAQSQASFDWQAAEEQRQAERAQIEESKLRQYDFCRQLVERPRPVDVIGLAAAVLPDTYDMQPQRAISLLPVDSDDWDLDALSDHLAGWVAGDQRRSLQVLYAMALAEAADLARQTCTDPWERRLNNAYWQHLEGHGYELSDLERTWIAAPPDDDEAEAGLGDVCERCGCTDDNACEDGCSWARPGLCSACVEPGEAEAIAETLATAGDARRQAEEAALGFPAGTEQDLVVDDEEDPAREPPVVAVEKAVRNTGEGTFDAWEICCSGCDLWEWYDNPADAELARIAHLVDVHGQPEAHAVELPL